MNRPMQNGEALYHAINAVSEHLKTHEETLSAADLIELGETIELLHQMKKEEEIRRDEHLGASVEEELFDILSQIQELHFEQGKVWALTVCPWITVRNALYMRTGVCLSKGMIIRRYYDFCREADARFFEGAEETGNITGKNIVDGLAGLYKEIRDVRG